MQRAQPDPFTPKQLEGAKELRKRLAHILPLSFNTDFFLARWYRAYNGDFDIIENKLSEVIAHRQALGYDDSGDVLKCSVEHDYAIKTFERFSISQLKMNIFSNDVAVFLQRMKNVDIKEIMKVIPLGHVLNSYYLLQECFHRAMYAHETQTGRQSAVVVVIDLSGLVVSDFINPLSTPSKLARYVVQIWSEYFTENLLCLFLVNPPGIISIMWQVAKQILDAKTQSRIVFIPKAEDIHKFLAKEAIPELYGGLRRDSSGFADPPESCLSAPKIVNSEEYFSEEKFWETQGVSKVPKLITTTLKSKVTHTFDIRCESDQTLIWLFTTNCEIDFEIILLESESQKSKPVWPKITLVVLKTPENGFLKCSLTGTYQARFTSAGSSWLGSSKLTYKICAT